MESRANANKVINFLKTRTLRHVTDVVLRCQWYVF